MKRRRFLQAATGALQATASLAATASLPTLAAPAVLRRRKPNVLMIVTSQERPWDRLPGDIALPARRRIAEHATHFVNYFAGGTLSSPARAALYTGQHWQRSGMHNNLTATSDDMTMSVPTLGHMLQAEGYTTAYRGKWHLSRVNSDDADTNRKALQRYGFHSYSALWDSNGPHDGYLRDGTVAREAAEFIYAQRDSDRPWFLAANLFNPRDVMYYHKPSFGAPGILPHAAEPDDPLYKTRNAVKLPPNFGPGNLDALPANHRRSIEIMKLFFGDIPAGNEEAWTEIGNYYLNCLRDSDRHLTVILDSLERSGTADSTIVVFLSDHGELLGAHGMRDKGSNLYREVISPPLLIAHPESAGARPSAALVSAIDIAPTILAMIGIDARERAQRFPLLRGQDLSGVVASGGDLGPREAADIGVLFNQGNTMFMDAEQAERMAHLIRRLPAIDYNPLRPPRMPPKFLGRLFGAPEPDGDLRGLANGICDGRYKFARYFAPNDIHSPSNIEELRHRNDLELYDLRTDPWEMNNLAGDPAFDALLWSLSAGTERLLRRET